MVVNVKVDSAAPAPTRKVVTVTRDADGRPTAYQVEES